MEEWRKLRSQDNGKRNLYFLLQTIMILCLLYCRKDLDGFKSEILSTHSFIFTICFFVSNYLFILVKQDPGFVSFEVDNQPLETEMMEDFIHEYHDDFVFDRKMKMKELKENFLESDFTFAAKEDKKFKHTSNDENENLDGSGEEEDDAQAGNESFETFREM